MSIGTYTDQELDSEVGLYNYNARLYDPAVGIFISPDSIVPDWFDPQALNRYAYTLNNPLKYQDPSGHFAITGSIALGFLAAKIGALAISWAGIQGAVHFIDKIEPTAIEQPNNLGNKIWSGALEVNRVQIQSALEFSKLDGFCRHSQRCEWLGSKQLSC